MGKYIIEVDDKYVSPDNELIVSHKNLFDGCSYHIQIAKLTPYTEPDMEQVRKEAYDKGYDDATAEIGSDEQAIADKAYQSGLSDAWDAVTKIATIPYSEEEKVFGSGGWNFIRNHTASEAIEKIRRYEQEKEKEIHVGDEVKGGDERYVVLQKYLNNIDELMVVLLNRRNGEIDKWHLYNANGVIFEKTGKHFPEIIEVLQRMKKEG